MQAGALQNMMQKQLLPLNLPYQQSCFMLAYRPTCRVIRVQTNRGPQETFFWGPQTLGMALVGHAGSVSGVCVCVCGLARIWQAAR